MSEISKCENVFCKMSGMITEADYNLWTPEQITPYMDLILTSFGSKRILFGSDWPVCLVAGSYKKVKELSEYDSFFLDGGPSNFKRPIDEHESHKELHSIPKYLPAEK